MKINEIPLIEVKKGSYWDGWGIKYVKNNHELIPKSLKDDECTDENGLYKRVESIPLRSGKSVE